MQPPCALSTLPSTLPACSVSSCHRPHSQHCTVTGVGRLHVMERWPRSFIKRLITPGQDRCGFWFRKPSTQTDKRAALTRTLWYVSGREGRCPEGRLSSLGGLPKKGSLVPGPRLERRGRLERDWIRGFSSSHPGPQPEETTGLTL